MVREFFTTNATIPMAPNEHKRTVWNEPEVGARIAGRVTDDFWEIAMTDLWAEYWDGAMEALPSLLSSIERARAGEAAPEREGIEPPADLRGPLVYLQTDVMRRWRCFFELDGSADPPLREHGRGHGWSETLTFSSWLFRSFADSYVSQDWTPSSFWGKAADLARSEEASPVQPFKNGLWLRASQGPLGAEAHAALQTRFSCTSRPYATGATLHHFSQSDDGWIWVVEDDDSSVWWIHGKTDDELLDLARDARELGRLTVPFVADTREGARVLARLHDV
ncbi:hypothetical protein DAT35_34700 [Vitiosangium sp. GDMCC 1.1324]|nr:hypothetical protein DAT35_34700 [Vitiosangium sp. GDMCC 1.1324]